MLWIDVKYLNLITSGLALFKKKNEKLWNFRCPYCLDSQKKESKKRAYIYAKNNDLFFKCHNCSKGTTFSNFLNFVDPIIHKEYIMDRFVSGDNYKNHNYKQPVLLSSKTIDKLFKKKNTYKNIDLDSIASLENKHFARTYIESRQIPIDFYDKLFFTKNFKSYVSQFDLEKSKSLKDKDPRIVIPFFDESGDLIAFQGRSLEDSSVRYISIKVKEENQLIFGLERLNPNNRVWVFEGPIDSLFIRNGLAVSGSDLTKLIGKYNDIVFVFDNEPNNKDIVKIMGNIISKGEKIIIWNSDVHEKDVNDMVLSGIDIEKELNNSVCMGLEAVAKLNWWKRV